MMDDRHEAVAVRLYDPLEMVMPDVGLTVMEDAETGEQILLDTHDKKFRKRFSDVALRKEREMLEVFERIGADMLSLSTEADLIGEIIRFGELRKRKKASHGGR